MRKICAIIFTLWLLSTIASAQLPSGGNVFLGYSYLGGETFTSSTTVQAAGGPATMNGWEASAEGQYLPWLGAAVDFDWHYGGHQTTACSAVAPCKTIRVDGSRHVLLFGPRASLSWRRYVVFAELLLGMAHQSDVGGGISNSDLTFASALGGGVDWKLTPVVAWQAKIDYVRSTLFHSTQNDLRISTGAVFRF